MASSRAREIEAQESAPARGEVCYAHPPDEHSICRRGLKTKGASGGCGDKPRCRSARRLAKQYFGPSLDAVSGETKGHGQGAATRSALLGPRLV